MQFTGDDLRRAEAQKREKQAKSDLAAAQEKEEKRRAQLARAKKISQFLQDFLKADTKPLEKPSNTRPSLAGIDNFIEVGKAKMAQEAWDRQAYLAQNGLSKADALVLEFLEELGL